MRIAIINQHYYSYTEYFKSIFSFNFRCFSSVGRTGAKQQLSLARGCMRSGTIIHEFLHALGFFHEQSRPDRDEYIDINYANIQGGKEHNFRISNGVNSLGVDYDRVSIMHYSK